VRHMVSTVSGLAVIYEFDNLLEIWNTKDRDLVHYLGKKAERLCALADGHQVAATFTDGSLRIFDVVSGHCTAIMFGINPVWQLLGITCGRVALLGQTQVCIWDPNKRFPTTFIDIPDGLLDTVKACGMLDYETLVCMSLNGVWHTWDVITGSCGDTSALPHISPKACLSPRWDKILMVGDAMVFFGDQRVSVYQ